MRIIAVVMGEPESSVRSSEVSSMLDYAFAQYELESFLSTNSILDTVYINKAHQEYFNVVPTEDVTILNKKLEGKKNATYELKMDSYKLPIKKGDRVGSLNVYVDGNLYRSIDVTFDDDVNKADLITLYGRYLKKVFTGDIVF